MRLRKSHDFRYQGKRIPPGKESRETFSRAALDAHPAEVDAMRHAGWEKLRRCHTASARARQFLAALR